jgi:hypothetical protein
MNRARIQSLSKKPNGVKRMQRKLIISSYTFSIQLNRNAVPFQGDYFYLQSEDYDVAKVSRNADGDTIVVNI